jgi:hypothetical protein
VSHTTASPRQADTSFASQTNDRQAYRERTCQSLTDATRTPSRRLRRLNQALTCPSDSACGCRLVSNSLRGARSPWQPTSFVGLNWRTADPGPGMTQSRLRPGSPSTDSHRLPASERGPTSAAINVPGEARRRQCPRRHLRSMPPRRSASRSRRSGTPRRRRRRRASPSFPEHGQTASAIDREQSPSGGHWAHAAARNGVT